MRKNGLEKHLYYGLAILAVLFVVVGLTAAIKGTESIALKEEKGEEIPVVKTERPKEEGEAAENEKKKEEEKAKNPNIRVLLMTDGYQHTTHSKVSVSAASGLTLSYGKKTEEFKEDRVLKIEPDDVRFKKGKLRIQAKKGKVKVESLNRGYGTPSYAGVLELFTTAEGIVMINELPVESYLCGVVPSEMPSAYELEALKAQAVCARSYAYRQMENYAYPEYEAHVDDSTSYQVYVNSKPAKSTTQAVQETKGEVVRYNGKIVSTYYYSTSCGKTTNAEAWGTKTSDGNSYLQSVDVKGEQGDYEKELPWYRWEAEIPIRTLSDLIGLNTGTDVGTLESIEIVKTGPGGVALKIKAKGDKGAVVVETENKIRKALGGAGYVITRQDGTETDSSTLLPSAFFTIEKSGDTFLIQGGGFGHGIGMSQNGANEMAKTGKDYKEILTLFFQGVTIEI